MKAAGEALDAGFDGIESPAPVEDQGYRQIMEMREKTGLLWNAEVCTGGGYVPRRDLSVDAHLMHLRSAFAYLEALEPRRINCIAGLDAWPFEMAVDFYRRALDLADSKALNVLFETHRSRPMFTPWGTQRLLETLPELRITADISHWCVVSERLMNTEMQTIQDIAPRVGHIHARVGYDQGPQVPHPAAPEYADALKSHEHCWTVCWEAQKATGIETITMTPEFGIDGYLHHLPFTNVPVADLWSINQWMANRLRTKFNHWQRALT
jgi:sugar phosphate isomerase/epimerase